MKKTELHLPPGLHWVVYVNDFPQISSKKSLEVLLGAAKVMGTKIFGSFETEIPTERVAYVILGESHLCVHDFKDKKAILDMMACGSMNIQVGFDYIKMHAEFKDYEFVLQREGV